MRTPRLYGLFRVVQAVTKTGKARKAYVREFPELAYSKQVAIRVFQDTLLAGAFGQRPLCELRPIAKGMFGQAGR